MNTEEIMDKYPYFVVPYIEAYRKTDHNSPEGKRLCRLIAANIGNREVLKRVLGMEPPGMNDSQVQETEEKRSDFNTIDSFLEKYNSRGRTNEEIPLDTQVYVIENSDDESDEKGENVTEETLRELIHNHRYREAIEIIERQNLNNRKKNIYFADQIRFLKKLIDLEQQKQR